MITDADIARWQREGHPDHLIENWIRNDQRAQRERAHLFAQYNRRRNCAPGTPADIVPDVIEGEAVAVMDRPVAAADGGADCDTCGNMRHVIGAGEHGIVPCPACRAQTVDVWRGKSLDRYSSHSEKARRQTFANFKRDRHPSVAQAHDAARAFAADPQGWLVLHGSPGTGKSHLCAAIANTLIDDARPCAFVTMPKLAESIKSLFDKQTREDEHETPADRKRIYQEAPILIIDDIGAGTVTKWDMDVLYDILQPRYENQRPTVLVSNLDMTSSAPFAMKNGEEIRLDPRLVDRWTERGFSVVVQVTAPSARK